MTLYPAPQADTYFEDGGLKLVILQNLMSQGAINLGTPEQLAAHAFGRNIDLAKEGYSLLGPCLNYLLDYPLTIDLLQRVNGLYFDGGLEIYTYIWPFWDGESDTFDVRSFAGIENCPNITKYNEIAMCAAEDLRPLSALKEIRTFSLAPRPVQALDVLLGFPQLKQVQMFESSVDPEQVKILEELRLRGVSVKLC